MRAGGGRRNGRAAAGAAAVALCAVLCAASAARADEDDPPAPAVIELRDTVDFWRNLRGGVAVGNSTLNKAQASFRLNGEAVGWPGLSIYLQVFKTNDASFSGDRAGDIQTLSNIEAPDVSRLFEAWAAQAFGQEDAKGYVLVRAGLTDLNRAFDSIDPAGLFINSSHGIGPDLSRSSETGPSIFPVTGPAAQVDWRPAKALLLHAGVFALPDPARQGQFADLRVSAQRGGVVIAQADYAFAKEAQASVGVWRPTADEQSLADPARRLAPRPGVYGFVEGPTPLPGGPSGWIRGGVADGRVQAVSGYLGAGLVWQGLIPGRHDDRFGVALARAVIGDTAQRVEGLPPAETTLEATYSLRLNRYLTLQPDVQHIIHPALGPGLPDATVVGLRLVAFARLADH
jgi:porin